MCRYVDIGIACLIFVSSFSFSHAQISAQGQGGNDVVWVALGVEQSVGKRWTNKNAIAYSRHSSQKSWNAMQQSGVFTLREEIVYRFSKRVKIAQGFFYAERNYYDREHPLFLNEIRCYPRIYHEFSYKGISFSQYLRTDLRFFSGPGFTSYHRPLEIRNRYLMKATFPLDRKGKFFLIGITEFFFATDKEKEYDGSSHYTSYHFTENRSSIYLRRKLETLDAFFDVGVMTQTWNDTEVFRETLILQVDLIFINPFSRNNRE